MDHIKLTKAIVSMSRQLIEFKKVNELGGLIILKKNLLD